MSARKTSKRGRKPGRLYSDVTSKVHDTVKKYPGASTYEVATKANIGWATADKYLKALRREKKISSRKRGKNTIWSK